MRTFSIFFFSSRYFFHFSFAFIPTVTFIDLLIFRKKKIDVFFANVLICRPNVCASSTHMSIRSAHSSARSRPLFGPSMRPRKNSRRSPTSRSPSSQVNEGRTSPTRFPQKNSVSHREDKRARFLFVSRNDTLFCSEGRVLRNLNEGTFGEQIFEISEKISPTFEDF